MRITFCGGAKEVGASCLLLRIDGRSILLDCGIRLHSQDNLPDFRSIQENGGLDAFVVSHAHLDHSGSLPVISREYPQAPVFMTAPTRDLTRVLLYDSLKIMDRGEEIPVYAQTHVEEMLTRITTRPFRYPFNPFQGESIEITFFPAGHILGAASVYVTAREGSLFYSGDISSTPQRTVGGIGVPRLRPDVLILESTYGDRLHASRRVEEQRLAEMVGEVTGEVGKVLIPAFALGRAQEVLLVLRSAINRNQLEPVPIYVDGMVKDILRIYKLHPNYLRKELARRVWKEKEIFYSEWVKPVDSPEMRRKIVSSGEPCVVIASSGMLTGGPSCFYAEHFSKERRNFIAITGYQDEEAPGRQLLALLDAEGEKVLQLGETRVPVSCRLGKYGLSAHADRGELLGVVQKLSPRKIFLVHGSTEALACLGRGMVVRADIFVPKNGDEYTISFRNPRKQLKGVRIPSLDKGSTPGKEDIQELWAYLLRQEERGGYTAEELIYLWSGSSEIEEQALREFRELLMEGVFFEPDERRLFLYHPLPEESLQQEPEVMEVNEMLALAEQFFPAETGLYKKGARFEQKIALLTFNFPAVEVPRCGERIREFESRTGWQVEINNQCNISALKPLLRGLLQEQKSLLKKVSYHGLQKLVKAELSAEPSEPAALIQGFKDRTGLELELNYPGKQAHHERQNLPQGPGEILQRMEQNAALSLIESVFQEAGHTLYKKGVKSDEGGKYIELSFITPAIGEMYCTWIADLQKETGWRIKINPHANMAELISRALELLKEAAIEPQKTPGVFQEEEVVRCKLPGPVDDESWEDIRRRFHEETGFTLEYSF